MLGTANNRMSAVGQERRIETGLIGLVNFLKACETRDKRVTKKTINYRTILMILKEYIIDEDYMQYNINESVEYGG